MGAPGLAAFVTEAKLRALAGDQSFERGAAYFASGAVTTLVDAGDKVKACVVGSDDYTITLSASRDELDYTCTCPLGEEGQFCKHAVATGLAWLASRKHGATGPGYTGKNELDAVRAHLAGMSREALVDLLMEQVADDDVLRSRLGAQAARSAADPKALKNAVRKALAVGGFVDYRGMRALIQRALTVPDLLRGLIADGNAALAAELGAYAMQRGLAVYLRSDDSSGSFGEVLHSIADAHLEACRKLRPLPPAFAPALFDLKRSDEWDFFEWKNYAPLFDEAGRAAYRALAEKEWAKVPARRPGDRGGFDTANFWIRHIMEEIEREAGDIDALVAVKSRNLSSAYSHFEIAGLLAEAGRADEALGWAERGHAAFRHRPDSRLVEFLVSEYAKRKRFDDAVNVAWENFVADPDRRDYALLKRAAESAKAAAAWRDKALAWVRENCAGEKARLRRPARSCDPSLLIEINLEDGDSDAALREARASGCPAHLWFEIARAREDTHPSDAAAIYRAALDGIVGRTNNSAYDEGAELVVKVRALMRRARQEGEFAAWLEVLRARHKAKRNFMRRLDAATGAS